WCNGSTADSGSVCHGSNPCRAANPGFWFLVSGFWFLVAGASPPLPLPATVQDLIGFFRGDAFVKLFVAHQHGRGAAAGEALDKFDRELAVRGRLGAMSVRIEPEPAAEMLVQFGRAAEGATQGATNLEDMFAGGLLAEHGIKRDELENIDGLQLELAGGPLHGFGGNPAEMVLDGVQYHEGGAPLLLGRITQQDLIDLGFERGWDNE